MENNWLISAISGGTTGMVVGVVYIVYKMCKRSSCRSNCCGHKSSFSIDLEKGLNSNDSDRSVSNK